MLLPMPFKTELMRKTAIKPRNDPMFKLRTLVRNIRKSRQGKFSRSYSTTGEKGSSGGKGFRKAKAKVMSADVVAEVLAAFRDKYARNKTRSTEDDLCYRCGKKGHHAAKCPTRPAAQSVEDGGSLGFVGVVSGTAMAKSSDSSNSESSESVPKCSKASSRKKKSRATSSKDIPKTGQC